jgi:hypothetical protein
MSNDKGKIRYVSSEGISQAIANIKAAEIDVAQKATKIATEIAEAKGDVAKILSIMSQHSQNVLVMNATQNNSAKMLRKVLFNLGLSELSPKILADAVSSMSVNGKFGDVAGLVNKTIKVRHEKAQEKKNEGK